MIITRWHDHRSAPWQLFGKGTQLTPMNDRLNDPKAADLPDDVKAELLRRRDAVDAGESTIERDKGLDQVRRNLRERSKQLPR